MIKNLVIVESPAKAKTIENYLGKDFVVVSSYGHIRDLEKKNKGIEIDNNFRPLYHIPEEKKKVVRELKKLTKQAETVWLATDEDREGEAISWHLKEALELPEDKIKRIVFNEITKTAIQNAVQNPRKIDQHLVDAQQARRVLDRLVGFELSPILWRKVRPSLSAGRVQSVAVRLVVERERQIMNFKSGSSFKVVGDFVVEKNGRLEKFSAELSKKFNEQEEAEKFLSEMKSAEFTVASLEKKPAKKSPSAPFTTSTLQQEASVKLRFSVAKTMLIAQKLYEAGKITYMRTDSVNLSDLALREAEKTISNLYGGKYSHQRRFKTKSASAQEAHEAIRPAYLDKQSVGGSSDERALYDLIWKRTVASQMADAKLERTIIKIDISNRGEKFTAKGEVIKFDGFLKVYIESSDDENGESESAGLLPAMNEGDKLKYARISATQKFTRPPARYTEASLVKKLEELGIGRPSTYAPTISTIQRRGYVSKGEGNGKERDYSFLSVDAEGNLTKEIKTEVTGSGKGRLVPADIALLVSDFLLKEFPKIMDYKFTAHVEEELDEIANGEMKWNKMLEEFYAPFHKNVEDTIENSERVKGEKILGKDPKSGKQLSVRMARFGPVAQLSNPDDPDEKPQFAGLRADQRLETISFEEALDLFKLPRNLGEFEGEEVVAAIGRFGPYLRHKGKFYSLGKDYDPYTVQIEEAVEVIEAKRKADSEKTIKVFQEDESIKVLKGRWGPYLKAGRMNVRIPKDYDGEKLSYEEALKLIEETKNKKNKKKKN